MSIAAYFGIGIITLIIALYVIQRARSQNRAKEFLDLLSDFFPRYAREESMSDILYKDTVERQLQELYKQVAKAWKSAEVKANFMVDVYKDEEIVSRSLRIEIHSDPACKDVLSFLAETPNSWNEAPTAVAASFAVGRKAGFLYTMNLSGFATMWLEIPKNTSGVDAIRVEIHPIHGASQEWVNRFSEIVRVANYESWSITGGRV